ncbi:sulfuric ester hydrolase [Aureococcus anophagefferens]|nr:sulfuric ester hydrolase [Aureococcus anophagefferens]
MAAVTVNRAAYDHGRAADQWGVDHKRAREHAAHAFLMVDRPKHPPRQPETRGLETPHFMYRSRRRTLRQAAGATTRPRRASMSVVGVLFDDLRRLVRASSSAQELPEPAATRPSSLGGPKDLVDLARETEKRWNNGTRDALKSAEQRRLEATEAAKKDAALADGLDAALKLVDDDLSGDARLRREARVALGLEQPEVAVFDALHALRAARCAYTCVDWFFQRGDGDGARSAYGRSPATSLDYKLTIKNVATTGSPPPTNPPPEHISHGRSPTGEASNRQGFLLRLRGCNAR